MPSSTGKPSFSLPRSRDTAANDNSSAPRPLPSDRFLELEEARKTSSQTSHPRTAMLREDAGLSSHQVRSGVEVPTSSHNEHDDTRETFPQYPPSSTHQADEFGIMYETRAPALTLPYSDSGGPTLMPPPYADAPVPLMQAQPHSSAETVTRVPGQYQTLGHPPTTDGMHPGTAFSPLHMTLPSFRYTPFENTLDPVAAVAAAQTASNAYNDGLMAAQSAASHSQLNSELTAADNSRNNNNIDPQHTPAKPCDVYTCFNPTFCLLNACGCKLCRNHLGTVIRGSRTVLNDKTSAETPYPRKVFVCAACHTEAIRAMPSDAHNEVGAEEPEDKKSFSVQYLYNPSIGYTHGDQSSTDPNVWSPIQPASGSTAPPPSPLALMPQDTSTNTSTYQPFAPFGFMYPFLPTAPNDQNAVQPPIGLALPADAPYLQHMTFPLPPMAFVPFEPSMFQANQPYVLEEQAFSSTSPTQRRRSGHSRTYSMPVAPNLTRQQPRGGALCSAAVESDMASESIGRASGRAMSRPTHSSSGDRFRPQHRSLDYGSSRAEFQNESPAETLAVNRSPWPLVKIENIPFDTTERGLLDWLPDDVFPDSEHVKHPIHIILHRKSGRTLPHCYIEVKSLPLANELINVLDRKKLGDRTVRVKWERRGELMRDLFSQEGYFSKPAMSPAAAPLPPVPTRYVLPPGIISDKDLQLLLEYCHTSSLASRERPPERAFLNIASIIAKFPWADESLYSLQTRDAIFRCAREACKIALDLSHRDPSFLPISDTLVAVARSCDGFTEEQKEQLKAVQHPPFFNIESFPALGSASNKIKTQKQVQRRDTKVGQVTKRDTASSPEPIIDHSASLPSSPPLTPTRARASSGDGWSSHSPLATGNKLATSWSLSDIGTDRSHIMLQDNNPRSPPRTAPSSPNSTGCRA
ncbi:hypothetical protein OIV83_002133 [Microbotryomycetes sp. JL201]|nr:hypothetical protein OIV83_002133 [Microbotryomycetes sp. JL201]